MKYHSLKNFSAVILSLCFLASSVPPVKANNQSVSINQIDTPILFSQIITNDIELLGPYASESIVFSLPANWNLTSGAQLDLSMTLAFSAPIQESLNNAQFSVGKLRVEFNDVLIGVVAFNQTGNISQSFQIPIEAFQSADEDGIFELRFTMDSGWSCEVNDSTFLAIHTNSSITFSHEPVIPEVNLDKFPAPLYQESSIYSDSALAVIPNQPTAIELQSAMTVAAGLGSLASEKLKLDLIRVGQLTSEQIATNHLIIIGSASFHSLMLQVSQLPLPLSEGQFMNSDGGPDEGIIQIINSPWSNDKVVLFVAGNSDVGTLKAAQAISSGVLRSNVSPNLAIVQKVESLLVPVVGSTDVSLRELGYRDEELTDFGVNYSEYVFYIPSGQTLSEDAFFDLLIGHSALLDFERSGVVIRVNGTTIGSFALTGASAQIAANRVRFEIPPSVILTGQNVLEIRTSLVPIDKCTIPNFSALYGNIWADSMLHLPLAHSVINPMINYSLKAYPIPFAYSPTLDTTAFVLPRDDIESWRAAFNIARYLGDRTGGPIFTLAAYYGDELSDIARANHNFIMIGQPSKLPVVGEINDALPAPFAENSDVAIEPSMQVNYRISPQSAIGYVEMLLSPWNSDNVILMALGSTNQAVVWAASHLIEPQSYKLSGNFAIVNDQQVIAVDTRLTTITPSMISTAETPFVEVIPSTNDAEDPALYQPTWLLPILLVSVAAILLILFVTGYRSWISSKSPKK